MKKESRNSLGIKTDSLKDQLLKARQNVLLDKLKNQHLYEFVKEIEGKLFINDCNAIDLNACMASIDQQEASVIWICYAPPVNRNLKLLEGLVNSKVKAMLCIGEDSDSFFNAFGDHVELFLKIDSFEEAVLAANKFGDPGDVVLFSPGAPNYRFFETDSDWNEEFCKAIKLISTEG